MRGDTSLRIVGLTDGQVLTSDFTDITVLGSDAADFTLTVNGEAVSVKQVGQRSALASRHAAAWTYIAVRLRPGKNVIAVQQQGDSVLRRQLTLIVPGPAARMRIAAPDAASLLADGKSAVALTVSLFDKDGIAAAAPSLVTLHAQGIAWLTPDGNPEARGLQVLVKEGQAVVLFKAPNEAGSIAVRAELGHLQQVINLPFTPALRPMVAAGIVEGMVSLNNGRIDMGKGRVYARHEFLSSLGSAYEIEENARSYRTLVGIEGDYMEGGQAFSEYRGARPMTERGPEAAYGTRNAWQISDRLNLRASVERTHSLAKGNGARSGADASSVSTVVEYRHSAQLKGTTGLDVRLADADTSYLYTLGVGYKINESWTALGKNAIYLVRGKGEKGAGRDSLRARQRIGLAYRQAQGTGLNALGYYEHRTQRNSGTSGHGADNETAHIVSLRANAQPARHWEVSGRYAGKFKRMAGTHGHSSVQGHLVSGRVTRDLGKRWDAGLAASMFADSLGQRKQAFGMEAGYLLKDDLWLSVGYNAVGFTDRDFAGMAETQQGIYFRMRYKFDENSF